MLQQQLRQKDEDIAAKSAEIGDLKERVAELEKLKQQQQQLLSMKDSELAAAQQKLADARTTVTAAAVPPTTPAAQTAQTTQAAEKPQAPNSMPWLWGGLAFIGMALLAWLFMRRRPKAQPPKEPSRRGFDRETLAAGMLATTANEQVVSREAVVVEEDVPLRPAPKQVVIDVADVPTTPVQRTETPNWHSGWTKSAEQTPPAAPPEPRAALRHPPRGCPRHGG